MIYVVNNKEQEILNSLVERIYITI